MDFQQFLLHLPNIIPAVLPAEKAHVKMAPSERVKELQNIDLSVKNPRVAAVMMLFYPKNDMPHIILIVRNTYKGVHSSQIAFPGGKYEESDADFKQTALRETEEEIGIASHKIEVVKKFTPLYIPPSNFMVHPYLGVASEILTFCPDPREVADIIELSLADFLEDAIIGETVLSTSYANNIPVPAYRIQDKIVWGATAMMLSELREVLKNNLKG
jgi:8-oxo-dGTP pyrophosphatase MutT (NUDIX family)